MQDIVLIRKNGDTLDLNSASPYRTVKSMRLDAAWQQVHKVTLVIASAEPIAFAREDKIAWRGKEWIYFSFTDQTEVISEHRIEYTVSLYSPDKYFEDTEMLDTDADLAYIQGNEEPPMCGDVRFFGSVLCNNIERNNGRKIFKLGEYPETDLVYVEFTDYNCLACLNQLCERFDTFYTLRPNPDGDSEYILDFGRKVDPFPEVLSYGQDNGLYRLSRKSISTKSIVTKLLVLGSDKNLPAEYPYPRLRLPDRYPRSVLSDPDKIAKYGNVEGRYDSEIYPTRLGTITDIVDGDIYSFIDDTLDFDPAGSKIAVMRGKGLAGFQLECVRYDASTHKVTVAPFTNNNGMTVPGDDPYRFYAGDQYYLVDFQMPESYLTAAQENMAIDGERKYAEVSQPQVDYELEIDCLWLKELGMAPEVGTKMHIRDERVGVDKEIRIIGITQDLLKSAYQFEHIEISDIKAEPLGVQLYKTAVRSADKLRYAGLTDPSDSPSSGFAALQNALAQKLGYKDYDDLVRKYGGDRSIIYNTTDYDDDGNPVGLIDKIRADLIDVYSLAASNAFVQFLAANTAFIADLYANNLTAKSIRTNTFDGFRATLLNDENILKFERETEEEIVNPNKYVKVGYAAKQFDGIAIQPQIWMMSDDAWKETDGISGDIYVSALLPGAFGIGLKKTEPTMNQYIVLGIGREGNNRRSYVYFKDLPSTIGAYGAGIVYRGIPSNSLYVGV